MGNLITFIFGSKHVNPSDKPAVMAFDYDLSNEAESYQAEIRKVGLGQRFLVFGDENPTTGYTW